ncbi:MAG TPA: DNA methyltransferase [Tepidisphaeraceae bacterium]|nr:DNA methyltransferase [Tepidisphaeraceae bacterium]
MAFLFPTREKPVFGNDREKVTREAADRLALCFRKLISRDVDRDLAQRFILQTLVALFAEDIGLLPRYLFASLVEECKEPADGYDKIGGLFEAMNNPTSPTGGRYRGVRYFNGGIFANPAKLELYEDELNQLGGERGSMKGAASSDWSKVSPEIFGAIFQDSMDAEERHAYGAHYTSPVDIMKIVKPTISDPWTEAIEGAKSAKKLNDLLERLTTLRVLDPACGSGNFLYLAYREMKRLETKIRERLTAEFPGEQPRLIHVNARQFFGMDINSFAVELAKVTLMIGRKLSIDELHIADEKDLPLDNLDVNFRIGDALLIPANNGTPPQRTPWPLADIIIGNPPFLGAKRLKPERGSNYVNALRKLYPEVPGMADYCVYWFRRTHDHLPLCTTTDPFAGRAGLVGTQNIRNNQSRVGGLDHVAASGTIVEAVENQPWSGDANVHVSIVDWAKTQDANVLARKPQLWRVTKPGSEKGPKQAHATGPASKTYELDMRVVGAINSSLSDDTDLSQKNVLRCNKVPKRCFQGKIPGYEGFMINADDLARVGGTSAVVVPYLTGRELLDEFRIDRWAIDFGSRNMAQAAAFAAPFAHVREHVLPAVRASLERARIDGSDMEPARREHLERWWQFWNRRDELSGVLFHNHRYIACSRVTRRPVMTFLSTRICPSDLLQVFAFDDDYSFGILQSDAHFEWFRKSSRLKVESDLRYSVRDVFETFPWPQFPDKNSVRDVANAARQVRLVRQTLLKELGGGLRDIYRLLDLPGRHPLRAAHDELNRAVSVAYGFAIQTPLLDQLLKVNKAVAESERLGRAVSAPGIPDAYKSDQQLISSDCFGA